jgi:hypothetical protein
MSENKKRQIDEVHEVVESKKRELSVECAVEEVVTNLVEVVARPQSTPFMYPKVIPFTIEQLAEEHLNGADVDTPPKFFGYIHPNPNGYGDGNPTSMREVFDDNISAPIDDVVDVTALTWEQACRGVDIDWLTERVKRSILEIEEFKR